MNPGRINYRQTGISCRVVWVLLNRLLKIFYGFFRRLSAFKAPHRKEALETEVLRLWINWPGNSEEVLLLARQFDLNFPSHRLSYLPLHGECVADFAVVALGPQVFFGEGLEEIRGYAQVAARSRHGPFNHSIHVELSRDFRQWLLRALVVHGRGSGNHSQSANFS